MALSHPWSFPPLEEWVEQQWQCTRDWPAWLQRRKDKTTAKRSGGWDAGWTLPSSGLPSCVSEEPDQRMSPPPMMTPDPTWYCRNLSPKSAFLIYSMSLTLSDTIMHIWLSAIYAVINFQNHCMTHLFSTPYTIMLTWAVRMCAYIVSCILLIHTLEWNSKIRR